MSSSCQPSLQEFRRVLKAESMLCQYYKEPREQSPVLITNNSSVNSIHQYTPLFPLLMLFLQSWGDRPLTQLNNALKLKHITRNVSFNFYLDHPPRDTPGHLHRKIPGPRAFDSNFFPGPRAFDNPRDISNDIKRVVPT